MKSSVTFISGLAGKRRLGGSCDTDRYDDKRDGAVICRAADSYSGAVGPDGKGYRVGQAETAVT